MGLLGTEGFLSPDSWLQPPWPSLSSKGQIPRIANQGRERMLKQGRNCQETIVQSQGRVLVPPKGIHITMSLGAFKMSAFFIPEKNHLFSSVQLLSCLRLFETPWTAAHQTSMSNTNSQSLRKLISIESVMPSNHLISHLISSSVVPFSSHLQ